MASNDQTDNNQEQDPSKVKLTIDGIEVVVNKGELLIEAAAKAGKFVPRFCYHPRMEPVGVCRMCLVEVDGPRGPSLQPSCYVPADNGMVVNTQSDAVKKAQNGVLEYLLINHPLDCPVCDKGGECPLQDQALAYGPGESRFIEEKRHFAKPVAISQLVELDRERCIQCSRCTRFSEEVAGEAEIDFLGRGDRTEVAIFPSQPFDSYFSGNTVQICPVGALTATPYRFKSRPWDLEQVESTCTSCSVGCRVAVQSSANQAVRFLGIDVDEVNQSWLCDRGRFGFEAIYSQNRLAVPKMKVSGNLQDVTWSQAIEKVAEIFAEHQLKGADRLGVIGGSRVTNESAYAYAKLFKGIIGTDNVDAAPSNSVSVNSIYGLKMATINDVATSDLIISIGSDIKETAPVLFLRIRDAVVRKNSKLLEISPSSTPLSKYGTHVPVNFSNFSRIISEIIGLNNPSGDKVSEAASLFKSFTGGSATNAKVSVVYSSIDALRPLENLEPALLKISAQAKISSEGNGVEIKFLPVFSKPNTLGAFDMGLHPNLLPGRVTLANGSSFKNYGWEKLPKGVGAKRSEILSMAANSELDTLVLIGTDLLGETYDRDLVNKALSAVKNLICIDAHENETNELASVVFPALYDAERSGSITNIEGRVSRVSTKITGPSLAEDDWAIAVRIADSMGEDLGFESVEDIQDEISKVAPAYLSYKSGLSVVGESGVIVPVKSIGVEISKRQHDPIEVPGISSINHQGTPMYAGQTISETLVTDNLKNSISSKVGKFDLSGEFVDIDKKDVSGSSAGAELIVVESLVDDGTLIKGANSLAALIIPNVAKISPSLANELGCHDGDSITLKSGSAAIALTASVDSGVADNTVVVKKLDATNPISQANSLTTEVEK